MTKPKMILDCDPGHDDAMAILFAAHQTDLLGITTVSGNAPLSASTRNALLVCQIADIDIEVHSGSDRPLLIEAKHAAHVHGESGLDGPDLPELTRNATSTDAVRFIIDTVRAHDDVWLCPVGPMTNIALAIRQAPDIVERIAGLSFMGGSTGRGNVTAAAEFNIWADPHAARLVLASGINDVRMAGLNVTEQYTFGSDEARQMLGLGTRTGLFGAQVIGSYVEAAQRNRGIDTAFLHDPCAVMAVTHPNLFETVERQVEVSTGSVTVGMTVVDQRLGTRGPTNVTVLETIQRDPAVRLLIEAIGSYR